MTTSPSTSMTARAGAEGNPRRRWATPTRRRGSPVTGSTENRPRRWPGTAVAGEDGRPVAVEGQRGDQAHAVQFHRRPQLDPCRHRGAVDLGAQGGTRGREQQLQLGQALQGERWLGGEGMVGGQHRHEVLVEELGRHDLVSAEGERDDGEVELARGELLFELRALAVGHVQVDMGVPHAKEVEELGDQPTAGRADHAETHRPDHLFAQCGHVGHHRLELVHHPTRPLDHHLALLGGPSRRTVDQLDVELALQPGHMGRDVGLHRADGGRSGREAPGVRDAQQCLQVFQFHGTGSVRNASQSCICHQDN